MKSSFFTLTRNKKIFLIYFFLITIPACILGVCYNLTIEIVACIAWLYGMCFNDFVLSILGEE